MKLLLTLTSGTLAGRVFELETGFLTIGRGQNCSVRFDPVAERIASKQHAFIEFRADDGFCLTDNHSTNGTYINGIRVGSARLSDGDSIQFGANGVVATVRIEASGTAQPADRAHEIQQFNRMAEREPANVQASFQNFALGSMSSAAAEPSKTGRYIGIALTIVASVFLAMVVMVIMFASVGVVPAVFATVVAFAPALFYLLPFILLDRYDPEPIWLLALAFAWGALVAVVFSFFANSIVGLGLANAIDPETGQNLGAVIAAPVFEEASKGLGLVILLVFFRRYFDDILDGIVFAGVIALGFATVENVLYYGRAMVGGGFVGLVFLFGLRGILSPFAHATFTSMTGIACGISRESHKPAVRFLFPVLGYMAAVALHALWNGMAVFGADLIEKLEIGWVCELIGMGGSLEGLCAFLISYAILQIPLFIIFITFSLYIMRRQNKILNDMLAMDVARGLIPSEHARIATSAFSSSAWLIGGFFSGKLKARSRYVRAIGKLGLSYWHIQRATAAQGHTGSFQQNPILRDEVLKWRDQV